MQNLSTKSAAQIKELIGDFTFVSWKTFEVDGETRCRYTVTKPNGRKNIHLISYQNGSMQVAA